jgi:hypothetical protein
MTRQVFNEILELQEDFASMTDFDVDEKDQWTFIWGHSNGFPLTSITCTSFTMFTQKDQ